MPRLNHPLEPPRPRPLSPVETIQLDDQTRAWFDQGVVEKARVHWTNNPVFVAKPNGAVRVCIDCRPANAVMEDFDWPLPKLRDLRHRIKGATWFTRLDLKDAFFRIKIPKKWRYLTAFSSKGTRYQFRRMPFGLKTAPAVFQRFMDHVLQHHAKIAFWYIDDILVFAESPDQLDARVQAVRKVLTHRGCVINDDKSEHGVRGLRFAGMWIYGGGVGPNLHKVRDVMSLPPPRTKVEKQSALGLVSYLRDHIPLASHWMAELYPGKGNLLTDEQYEKEWRRLQEHIAYRITTLGHWDEKEEAQLYTDASGKGIGVVLMQRGRIIALSSRKLTPAETRYSTTDREHLSLTYAAKTMRIFLHRPTGATQVYNDHAALIGRRHDQMMPRQARWAEIVNQWMPNIQHVAGVKNPADFFSRWDVSNKWGLEISIKG